MTRKVFLLLAAMVLAVGVQASSYSDDVAPIATDDSTTPTLTTEDDEPYVWEFWWSAGFDLKTNYMWRGFDQSYRGGNRNMFDPSFQPGVSFGFGKFYIELWGNASLLSDYKEFDMFLGFEHENLLITV